MESKTLGPATISSNVLLHFTASFDRLLSILTQCFRPHYCPENLNLILPDLDLPQSELFEAAIPMVCFCDIPLSQAGRHFSDYGRYAIGLSKVWGLEKGVSPVTYAHPRSAATLALFRAAVHSHRVGQRRDDQSRKFWEEISPEFDRILEFVKPYQGPQWRDGAWVGDVRFYDEREWRWVPRLPSHEWVPKEVWQDPEALEAVQAELENHQILRFGPRDVRYLVVGTEEEIPALLEALKNSDAHDTETVRLLSSRVISAQQILEDF